MQLLRVLITGEAGGPQLWDAISLLGKDEVVDRLNVAIEKFSN
ncbi:MAG: hypothetical protein ACXWW0_07125 [Bacteroidia bacterium]